MWEFHICFYIHLFKTLITVGLIRFKYLFWGGREDGWKSKYVHSSCFAEFELFLCYWVHAYMMLIFNVNVFLKIWIAIVIYKQQCIFNFMLIIQSILIIKQLEVWRNWFGNFNLWFILKNWECFKWSSKCSPFMSYLIHSLGCTTYTWFFTPIL